MRVISGDYKGRKLKTVAGEVTRPTSDFVKESIFNILQFDVEGRNVFDAYAGTGQMGIEALSRGAVSCVFVDMSSEAIVVLKANVAHVECASKSKIIPGETLGYIASTKEKFDLIFLDPPYKTALMPKSLQAIKSFDILREGGIICCEAASDEKLPELEGFTMGKMYKYGSKSVVLYTKASA